MYSVDFELTTLLFTTFLMGEEVPFVVGLIGKCKLLNYARIEDSNYIFYNIKDNMG